MKPAHRPPPPAPPVRLAVKPSATDRSCLELDACGLKDVPPLGVILRALEGLPDGKRLRAHTDAPPDQLFGSARLRGFSAVVACEDDGSWTCVLQRF
jgi:hypothetical protein